MESNRRKVILLFTLLLILVAMPTWATDYYVRPNGGNYGDEDGSSYYNAWDGFANINWTTVDNGNGKLFVAGTHREQLEVGADGEGGTPIQIVSCTAEYGCEVNDPAILLGSDDGESITWTQVSTSGTWNNETVYHSGNNSFLNDVGSLYYNTNTGTISHGEKYLVASPDPPTGLDTDWEFWYDDDDSVDSDGVSNCIYVYHSGGSPDEQADGIEIPDSWDWDGSGAVVKVFSDEYVDIKGLTIKYSGNHGIRLEDAENINIDKCIVLFSGGQQLSGTTRYGGGFHIQGNAGTSQDINITNCIANECYDAAFGVETDADGVAVRTIQNVTFENCSSNRSSSSFHVAQLGNVNHVVDNITFSKCTATNSGKGWAGNGNNEGRSLEVWGDVSGSAPTNITFEDCLVSNSTGISAAIYGVSGLVFRRNIILDAGDKGMDIRTGSSSQFHDTYGEIYLNIIASSTYSGIYINETNSTNYLKIYNNILYDNGDYGNTTWNIDCENAADYIEFKNNISAYSQAPNTYGDAIHIDSTCGSNLDFDYNLYYNTTTNKSLVYWGPLTGNDHYYGCTEPCSNSVSTDYPSDKSQDTNSPNPSTPNFVDASTNNFRLTSSSTNAINKGVDLGDSYTYAFDFRDTSFPYDTLNQDDYGSSWEIGPFIYSPYIKGTVTDNKGKPVTGKTIYVTAYTLVGTGVDVHVNYGTYISQTTTDPDTGEYWLLNLSNGYDYFVLESYFGEVRGKYKWAGAKKLTATSQ